MSDLLLELGLDEIPARMIAAAEAELGRRLTELLTRERLLADDASVTTYSTPRRLAALATCVLPKQADSEEELTGPSWSVAFKDGAPTKAAEAFAKKAGVAVSELKKVSNPKGEYVGATVKHQGVAAPQVLAAELPKEVLSIYWPKNMYWRAGKPERFVRPIRWLVALLDSEIAPLEIAGIAAGNQSRGHRILHGNSPVVVSSPAAYAETLRAAKVIVDVAERRQIIRKALDHVTRTIPGARWREDEPLVETVTHLTEWPSVILGNFEPEYLTLPEEVLVTVMRDHQKYFAIEDANGKLAPHFLAVLNTEVDEEGQTIIRNGNARELRARFKDAQFFWDFDQKIPLKDRVESLKNVTFQKELGSYYWKTEENERIAKALFGLYEKASPNPAENSLIFNALQTAVRLSKTDLTTELVKEFTELQGIIGGLYARAQGLDERVAMAIYDQYTPASIEDPIPTSIEGQLLGIADRIQTISAMLSRNFIPTGSRDPFALRRAANGVIKILAESNLPLTLKDVLIATEGRTELADTVPTGIQGSAIGFDNPRAGYLPDFLVERVSFYLKEVRGFAYDVVAAVFAAGAESSDSIAPPVIPAGADDVRDAIARAEALTAVRGSDDFAAVSAAFKRIKNILRQAAEKNIEIGSSSNIQADEALRLRAAANSIAADFAALRGQRAYSDALSLIATLRPVVDTFFDKVMVLDSDPVIRGANLALIDEVLRNFSTIADFSEIVTSA